jgi:LmbE family N-acetylglucosaminyl deacetylase
VEGQTTPGCGGTRDEQTSLAIISPHLDDAVLSCGQLIAANPGSHVVTVFSSGPKSVAPLPPWDEMSGWFKPGDNVMAMRQVEDDEAMAQARAHAHRLAFWDEQYRTWPPARWARLWPRAIRAAQAARANLQRPSLLRDVERALHAVVSELDVATWLAPLGLWHTDHKLVARAALCLARQLPERRWVLYEELPYRLEVTAEVDRALEHVRAEGFSLAPANFVLGPSATKRSLVSCYRSQLDALGNRVELAMSGRETFHVLAPSAR